MRGVFIFVVASLCSACQGLEPASAPLAQSPDVAAAQRAAPSGTAPASAGSQTVGEPLALGAAETAPPTPTVPPSAPPAEKPRHVQLTALQIDPDPAVGASTPVALTYAGSHAPVVKKVCFLWSGDGPYCWDYLAVDAKAGRITSSLTMKEARNYTLEGYVEYETAGKLYKSNKVSESVTAHQ